MMRKTFFLSIFTAVAASLLSVLSAQAGSAELQRDLSSVYTKWRNAMVQKDAAQWRQHTARHRQQAIKNRIHSERGAFPQAVFQSPVAPPSLKALKAVGAHQKGRTATGVYFGKVDFGVGGMPTDNVLLLHFVQEAAGWKYDQADFIALEALPKVRKQLQNGDLSYVQQADFKPTGVVPAMPQAVAPVQMIAKVYAFCPGREVRVRVNQRSDHRFQDTKAAEVVIGGAKVGINELQFSTKALEGSTGKEPICVRLYLMSTKPGMKPIKAYEYLVPEGGVVKPFGSQRFKISEKTFKSLR